MFLSGRVRKAVALLGMLIVGVMLAAGCGGGREAGSAGDALTGKVTASGSTALLPLLKPAQEEFQAKHARVTVNIAGGGSFTGMNQVADGSVQIGNSDVNLPEIYKDKGLVDHKVVVEPFVFIVNKENKIENLTEDRVVGILTGQITNWNQIGGADLPVTLIHRAKSSGSRATIAEVVLHGKGFTDHAVIQDSNGAVRTAVASTPGAIGYVDAPYADDSVKMMAYQGVPYTPQAVLDGKYPIFGYGHLYTKGEPDGAVKAFIDYVLSEEFQNSQVEKLGFIPINKMQK